MTKTDAAILAMTEKDIERFLAKLGEPDSGGCRRWSGGADEDGYGMFSVYHGCRVRAHRVAFFLANGRLPGPETPLVTHSCNVPACCEDAHLVEGTHTKNMDDRAAAGRTALCGARGDAHGLRLHPERVARGDGHYTRRNPELVRRGTARGNTKLTEEAAAAMRALHAETGASYAELGALFGVGRHAAKRCVLRITWTHVP